MPRLVLGRVQVSVPATSANLGPGFDSLGLALAVRDRVTVGARPAGLQITVGGAGADVVPRDQEHLVHRAMVRAFAEMSCPVPGIRMHCENRIPHGRGLGSSAAAIVAGLCAARGLVAGGCLLLDDSAVFRLAVELEGHPDNVAAALFGGFTIACSGRDGVVATAMSVDPRVSVVVFVPPDPVATEAARSLLPEYVPHADATANTGCAALLVAALSREPELLLAATEDRLHQSYRRAAMPHSFRLVLELRADGVPAVISGAGPAVLAFADSSTSSDIARRTPQEWQALRLPIDRDGAVVDHLGAADHPGATE